jgi:hypothetical protein
MPTLPVLGLAEKDADQKLVSIKYAHTHITRFSAP